MSIEELGGRKFLLSILVLCFTFLLILFNKLDSAEYLKVTFAIIGLYAGLNVYQKVKELTK